MALRSVPMFPCWYAVLSFAVGILGPHLLACSGCDWSPTGCLYSGSFVLPRLGIFSGVEGGLCQVIFWTLSLAMCAGLATFVLSWGYQNRVVLGFYIMCTILTTLVFLTWFVSGSQAMGMWGSPKHHRCTPRPYLTLCGCVSRLVLTAMRFWKMLSPEEVCPLSSPPPL